MFSFVSLSVNKEKTPAKAEVFGADEGVEPPRLAALDPSLACLPVPPHPQLGVQIYCFFMPAKIFENFSSEIALCSYDFAPKCYFCEAYNKAYPMLKINPKN